MLVEVAAHHLVDAVADAQGLLQGRPAQVEVAVLEALLFAGVDGVGNLEGRRVALVEDRELHGVHLHLAGRRAWGSGWRRGSSRRRARR